MAKLLIVESPAKCKKIQGYLGAGWRVQATMGHIRSLKEELTAIGFDAARGAAQSWTPAYEAIATKRDAIASLKKAAQAIPAANIYLGADDDREGEAIAWHTCHILGLDPTTAHRVVFHEITEGALRNAVENPGHIDLNKFNAQQARTMLDMLIGFTLSPCLWRAVGYKPGLSAGRCQTPALRIIYERDRDIEAHQTTLSWRLRVTSDHDLTWTTVAEATEAEAQAALRKLVAQPLVVQERKERVSTHQPPKPFITSSLQQEASNRLGMGPKITMKVAQTLYEAGHITYMRTDNATLSEEATMEAAAVVTERWGTSYLAAGTPAGKPKKKKTAAVVVGAHEAIRPTHFEITEPGVGPQELRLYRLIWTRAVQSVMAPEQRDVVKLAAQVGLETTWEQTRFAGWRIIDTVAEEEAAAAELFNKRKTLIEGTRIPWLLAAATEVRTSPPSRYTEASLVRELESKGIGRPSTYATLVDTVLERGYVEKATIPATAVQVRCYELKATAKEPKATTKTEKSGGEKDKLRTTALGRTVIEWLLTRFDDVLAYDFTAALEARLDEVAKGSRPWPSILQETWTTYAERYAEIMTTPSTATATFGDGYKLVMSKKGPLFVLEVDGQKTRFANVPTNLSIQTATRADAEAAFAACAEAEPIGELDGSPVVIKKGPYGYYASWKEYKVNCKADETLEDLEPRLRAKIDALDHTVGPYKIRRGPYGLYMFRTGTKGKPTFVSIPDTTPWASLTPESAEQIYKQCMASKKAPKKK